MVSDRTTGPAAGHRTALDDLQEASVLRPMESSADVVAHQEPDPPRLAPARVMQISPLIAAGSRFPVGTGNPDEPAELGPVEHRSFLLRGAESVRRSPNREGGTPKVTTGYDGTDDDESEDFTQPDFSP